MFAITTAPVSADAVFLPNEPSDLGLIVRYDGTDYHGFQKQAQVRTIQGDLERALTQLMGPGRLVGASRTDAGVHAEGQVAVWHGAVTMPVQRVPEVVNRKLPAAIRIREAFRVPAGWDPRRSAVAKQYSYRLWCAVAPPPVEWQRLVFAVSQPLAWPQLQKGARIFMGTHDFRAFRTEGSHAETTVRQIYASRWAMEQSGRIWRYQVIGSGFLYRMVRHMVGSMLEAAKPGGSLEALERGLAFPDEKVTALAPARGLMLDWIQCR